MALVLDLVIAVHLRIAVVVAIVVIDKGEREKELELLNICDMLRTLIGLLTLILRTPKCSGQCYFSHFNR